jgi:hypothetical protein
MSFKVLIQQPFVTARSVVGFRVYYLADDFLK